MNLLIKSAKIIDTNSPHNGKVMDILIKNNRILNISKSINSEKVKIFKAKNLHISPGWFDMHVNFAEPGYEQRETIRSGTNAAKKGGYTSVMTMPNTNPSIDNKGMIEFIKIKQQENIIDIYPAGNLTLGQEGNEIVEMHDMKITGCVAFTDDKKTIQRSDVMKIAMLYSKDCNGLIMNYPNDQIVSDNGCVNEGVISTKLGLKGIPSLAEEIMLDRDLSLCEYTKSKLHVSYISTNNSVTKIKNAKSKGLDVTSDVTIYNLFLTDEKINDFDTRYKVIPPLRTIKDNKSLIKGLQNGTIDVITCDHTPIDEENKKIEFDNAAFGIIGLETSFGLIGKYLSKHLNISEIIEKISINPRKILGLKTVKIMEGEKANMTLFDPTLKWTFKQDDIKSKSKNTPFVNHEMKGKALAIFNNGKFEEC